MQTKVRVLHIAQAAGGVDRYLRSLLKYFDREKFENILLCSYDFKKDDYDEMLGNITGLGFDTEHPGVTAPTSSNDDSYNAYYHDNVYVGGSSNNVVYTGGGWSWDAGFSGLWYWYGGYSSTDAISDVGSRLLKKAL